MRKSFPKNFVSLSQCSLPVRIHAVSYPAIIAERPIVIGTNRKW